MAVATFARHPVPGNAGKVNWKKVVSDLSDPRSIEAPGGEGTRLIALSLETKWWRSDERGGAASHGDRARATVRRPSNCSRWSTTSSAGWPPGSWRTRRPARRSRPRPWCTRRTCGWSAATRTGSGTAGATSSPRRPRPCGASWSRPPGARPGRSGAAGSAGSTSPTRPPPTRTTISSPSTTPSTGWRAEDPVAAKVVELRQFAGLGHEEVAAALGITVYLARQKWTYARAWLRDALGG